MRLSDPIKTGGEKDFPEIDKIETRANLDKLT